MNIFSPSEPMEFLNGGGSMGEAIRGMDWNSNPLGPPSAWPAPLRMAIRLMLTTNHPIFVFWGQDLRCFYNDAYSQSIGPERHPVALGQPGRAVWDEIWDIIGPQIDLVMSGEGATWHVDHLVPITRHGQRQDVYWTYSYSPIDDPSAPNGVGGVLVICTETTERILAERSLAREVEAKEMLLREVNHRVKNSLQLVSSMLRIECSRAESKETRRSLARASGRVQAIGSMHELIYRSEHVETVDFEDFLGEFCRAVTKSALGRDSDIDVRCDATAVTLPTDLAISLALICNELMTNAIKHAFPDGRNGVVEVRCREDGRNVLLTVRDNGVGMPEDNEHGLGTRLLDGLVRQIGGELRPIGVDRGHAVEIAIPLTKGDD